MTFSQVNDVVENNGSVVSNITHDDSIEADNALSLNDKKRRIETVYSNGQWKDEDEYEIAKIRQVIRNHIFKHVKFVKGEGSRPGAKRDIRKKQCKDLVLGKCHERPDLTKSTGYECEIMRLVGLTNENLSITTRALWWKTYNQYIHHEIRQLRGRMNACMKASITDGK